MKTIFALSGLVAFLLSKRAEAHVKWFAQNTEQRTPIEISALNRPLFWGLVILSAAVIGLLVFLDRKFEKWTFYGKINDYIAGFEKKAASILRIFTGASILLAWQSNSLIAPELAVSSTVGWIEFSLVLLLLTEVTTPIAGLGMMGLYVYAISQSGLFHLLDYIFYPAIGYFFLVSASKNKFVFGSRTPALYIGLGLSLCWVSLEKIFFPHWGLNVLAQRPELTMGLPHDFFLMATAFVEMSLGYLLLIGTLQRPLAVLITIVFLTTTVFFGKTEVIGHTILHGALLVFILIGPGTYYPAPISFHKKLWLRVLFAAVNFLIIMAILGLIYFKFVSGRGND